MRGHAAVPARNAHFLGDVAESSVPVIAKQQLALRAGNCSAAHLGLDHSVDGQISAGVRADKKIEVAVIVIVEEDRRIRGGLGTDASWNADIFKTAVAEIAEQKRTGIIARG